MMRFISRLVVLGLAASAFAASAEDVSFKDPTGDDKGPGNYVYPTDPVYKPGSFDLTELTVKETGGKVELSIGVNSDIEDPWGMPAPAGFSVQMAVVHINTGKGALKKGIPGTNVEFADGYDKIVILSPQPAGRVKAEAKQKAGDLKDAIIVPAETKASGRVITAVVDKKELGDGAISKWGYQVLMQSNEGFPDKADLLTRKVNEYEGQHRFGGGNDGDCDPHVIDILGEDQQKQLAYECGPDGSAKKLASLKMVRK